MTALQRGAHAGIDMYGAFLHANDHQQVPVPVSNALDKYHQHCPVMQSSAAFAGIASLLCLDLGDPLGFLACPDPAPL